MRGLFFVKNAAKNEENFFKNALWKSLPRQREKFKKDTKRHKNENKDTQKDESKNRKKESMTESKKCNLNETLWKTKIFIFFFFFFTKMLQYPTPLLSGIRVFVPFF